MHVHGQPPRGQLARPGRVVGDDRDPVAGLSGGHDDLAGVGSARRFTRRPVWPRVARRRRGGPTPAGRVWSSSGVPSAVTKLIYVEITRQAQ